MELTNRIRKLVASLDDLKSRRENGLFVAEGTKCVLDTVGHFNCRYFFATSAWLDSHSIPSGVTDPIVATRADMERMSHLSTPPAVIAVYDIPEVILTPADITGRLVLALDRVQDPGNLGTIVRIADWFGIDTIICSHDTVDLYNPKVVQATMGAISRVKVGYNLHAILSGTKSVPIFGTFLEGEDIFKADLSATGVIVMGNEGQGISPEIERFVTRRITIPSYPGGVATSESLNVGMATAITVAEFRRRQL